MTWTMHKQRALMRGKWRLEGQRLESTSPLWHTILQKPWETIVGVYECVCTHPPTQDERGRWGGVGGRSKIVRQRCSARLFRLLAHWLISMREANRGELHNWGNETTWEFNQHQGQKTNTLPGMASWVGVFKDLCLQLYIQHEIDLN